MNLSRLCLNSMSRLLSLETSFANLRSANHPRQFSESTGQNKPPPSPFLLFYHSKLPEIKELHKNAPNKVTKWSKTASSMWKDLDEDGKKRYQDIFHSRREQYLSSITEAELMDRKKLIQERRVKNEKRRHKQEAKNLNKPKKPPTAHGLYIREQTTQSRLSQSDMRPVFTKLSHEWTDMPESDKERFVADAREKKEQHEKKLRAWEDEQIENNRKYLVRIYRLKELSLLEKPTTKKTKKEEKAKEAKKAKDNVKVKIN